MAAISTTSAAAQAAFVEPRLPTVVRDGEFSGPPFFQLPALVYLIVAREIGTNEPGGTAVKQGLDVATKAGKDIIQGQIRYAY
jgi:hypothetical protein